MDLLQISTAWCVTNLEAPADNNHHPLSLNLLARDANREPSRSLFAAATAQGRLVSYMKAIRWEWRGVPVLDQLEEDCTAVDPEQRPKARTHSGLTTATRTATRLPAGPACRHRFAAPPACPPRAVPVRLTISPSLPVITILLVPWLLEQASELVRRIERAIEVRPPRRVWCWRPPPPPAGAPPPAHQRHS